MDEKLHIENRIAILSARPNSNSKIINKLKRRLRVLDNTK